MQYRSPKLCELTRLLVLWKITAFIKSSTIRTAFFEIKLKYGCHAPLETVWKPDKNSVFIGHLLTKYRIINYFFEDYAWEKIRSSDLIEWPVSVLLNRWYPIQCLMVPKGCSTIAFLLLILSGFLFIRSFGWSITSS